MIFKVGSGKILKFPVCALWNMEKSHHLNMEPGNTSVTPDNIYVYVLVSGSWGKIGSKIKKKKKKPHKSKLVTVNASPI